MHLTDFHYHLPQELIAQYPLKERSSSRLLCLNKKSNSLHHQEFKDLPKFLKAGDLLIFNDTKVMPARLYGKKTSGGQVEILIERIFTTNQAFALIRASKAPKKGSFINLENNARIEIINKIDDLYHVHFHSHQTIDEILDQQGHIPLPRYLARADELIDQQRYQTVFAKQKGSVAAPTAGLHFDDDLLKNLTANGIHLAFITLHVGLGTFQPVRVLDIKTHTMHPEFISVSESLCEQIRNVKNQGHRIIAVGTTTARALETAIQENEIKPFKGETNLFIYPGFNFRCIDALITNFHLPASTLLMLICAFAGHSAVMQAYQEAISERYRFYSYGDAMFIY